MSVAIGEHPDIVGLPSHAARWAFILLLTRAKGQPEPGTFRTEAQVGHILGRGLRQTLPALVAAGLMAQTEEGGYVVRNWERWQTPERVDHTNADRQRRFRERERGRRNAGVTPVTEEPTVTLGNGGPPTPVGRPAVAPPATKAAAVTASTEGTMDSAGLVEEMRKARAHISILGGAPTIGPPERPSPTIDCADFRAHQFQHRQDPDGSWRCLACAVDPDHADPLALQVASEWDFEAEGGSE